MMAYKTARGQAAMARLKVFEGVPPQYQKVKKMAVSDALKVLRLKPGRNWCRLGDVAAQVGWSGKTVLAKYEAERKERSLGWFRQKKEALQLRSKAEATVDASLPAADKQLLQQFGY